ncbi:MAG: glycosyltransferase family 4 protein [Pseudomonadota bacterium]|nr:glycosyltransferase family 4 protein [Pseudomonadota bacterium]
MALRVVLNATPLLAPRTGVGNYIAELGNALAQCDEVDLYGFYGYRWRHGPPAPPAAPARSAAVRSFRELVKPWVPLKRQLRHAQQQLLFGRGLRKYSIELYHEPNYVPIRYDVPVVVTVHDLSWIRFPQTHPPDRVRWLNRGLPRAMEQAAAILVDSTFVRDELAATFPVSRNRIHVAQLGVSGSFRPRSAAQTFATLQAFDLRHRSYVLSVGTVEPRKNLEHILRAFALLPPALQNAFPLVIAGARGWRSAALERELRSLTDMGRVRFVGHISDAELIDLYAGAALFVFPSLYEGFGLPPLEAMACGTPVLVSDRASLPEVVGDAGVMLNPLDADATATQIQSLLEDPQLRDQYAQRGLSRAAGFTWATCAQRTLAAFRAARP